MSTSATPLAQVLAYHERTKHQVQRFAAGPETLDWDAQPSPFRDWGDAPMLRLPLVADALACTWGELSSATGAPVQALTLDALACLLELSFALTAWKQFGPDRWALRANPSSGNLHPTEVYVMARQVPGLRDGLYHYAPFHHALVLRAAWADPPMGASPGPGLWLGLSSIQWREAWKYGERAFRYGQLDAGHAVGAARYAAAALGWGARVLEGVSHQALAALMGLDRDADFGQAEREEPELLMALTPGQDRQADGGLAPLRGVVCEAWFGRASRLDAHPMYRWPVIDEVATATRWMGPEFHAPMSANTMALPVHAPCAQVSGLGDPAHAQVAAAELIRGRRSAQHFDRKARMPLDAFWRLLAALVPSAGLPWDAWPAPARVHPVFYPHRVEGLAPGAYVLPRSEAGEAALRQHLLASHAWGTVPQAPTGLPLWALAENPALAGTLRTLSCHQAIGSDACLAVSLVAEFAEPLNASPAHYRALYQEAGLLGQVLYLQAEAEGLRGTGVGCYFDDAVHTLLGLRGLAMQVLYHFTVGLPLVDTRIATESPYAHLSQVRPWSAEVQGEST